MLVAWLAKRLQMLIVLHATHLKFSKITIVLTAVRMDSLMKMDFVFPAKTNAKIVIVQMEHV